MVLGWWFGCLCSGAWVWVWVLLYDVCIRASSWALLFGGLLRWFWFTWWVVWGCCDGIALFGVFGLDRFVVWFACGLCSLWGWVCGFCVVF